MQLDDKCPLCADGYLRLIIVHNGEDWLRCTSCRLTYSIARYKEPPIIKRGFDYYMVESLNE